MAGVGLARVAAMRARLVRTEGRKECIFMRFLAKESSEKVKRCFVCMEECVMM